VFDRIAGVAIGQQLVSMQLSPSLNQSLLPLGQCSGDEINRIDRENAHLILIVGVKVSFVMTTADLDEHANDDPIETTQLRHSVRSSAYSIPRFSEHNR
jgi:hypothetical protein